MRLLPGWHTPPLKENARQLLVSNLFEIFSGPFLTIFVTAFIWQTTASLLAVIAYSIGRFGCLPVAFWLNGLLLRRSSIRRLFWIGALMSGVVTAAVMLFAGTTSLLAFFLYGCISGLGWGIYWPNRNYLELQETADGARNYFFGAIHGASKIANVVVPLIAGWAIALGPDLGWYTASEAYWALFGVSLLLMLASAAAISRGRFVAVPPFPVTRFSVEPGLGKRRLLTIAIGSVNGLHFLFPVLILAFLGNEGILGTAMAIAALCAGLAMYAYGCCVGVGGRSASAIASSIGYIACALGLAFLPFPFNIIIFVLFAGICIDFFMLASDPIVLKDSDAHTDAKGAMRYSFIFDNELFLNVGRLLGIGIILAGALFFPEKLVLTLGPLIVGIAHLALVFFIFLVPKELPLPAER